MYTFAIGEGEQVTLRPEATAGVARALISGGLTQSLPLKVFYNGPMFRHERPQKGRSRQFHQIDVELLGVAEPLADVEIIALRSDEHTSELQALMRHSYAVICLQKTHNRPNIP